MIRINLLSHKKRVDRQEKTQVWLLVAVGLVLVEVVILLVFHSLKVEKLHDQERTNAELAARLDQLKKAVANHEEVKQKLAQLRAREDAITKLQTARTGPTLLLMELARILTPGRGPTMDAAKLSQLRRDDPTAAYSSTWDPQRLWLTTFKEEKRKLRIEGLARDGEDVSELARRMHLSDYFSNVRLLPAKREIEPVSKTEVVRFALEAEAKY
ncbi:MAG TPA: PilN domain-containing protein [Polyangiaceae bacterium]|nr:PilN domain-containing protein [Polyangiaceae bacterium]